MGKTVYKSKIDWWMWGCILIMIASACYVVVETNWWVALPLGGSFLIFVVFIVGCWYEIDGDELVVYQAFKPHKFPISKIESVKKTVGYLATAGMSSRRVSIKFSDRKVMKSAMPLEISPKDRNGFMAHLQVINPNIKIL